MTLPSTLIAGGKSAVRNKSEPPRATSNFSKSLMNLAAWSRSMSYPSVNSYRFSIGLMCVSTSGQQSTQSGAELAHAQRQATRGGGHQGHAQTRLFNGQLVQGTEPFW